MFIYQSCYSWNPRWVQERMTQSRGDRYKMEAEKLVFTLLSVTHERVGAFSKSSF
jgi:hypothetical protein